MYLSLGSLDVPCDAQQVAREAADMVHRWTAVWAAAVGLADVDAAVAVLDGEPQRDFLAQAVAANAAAGRCLSEVVKARIASNLAVLLVPTLSLGSCITGSSGSYV